MHFALMEQIFAPAKICCCRKLNHIKHCNVISLHLLLHQQIYFCSNRNTNNSLSLTARQQKYRIITDRTKNPEKPRKNITSPLELFLAKMLKGGSLHPFISQHFSLRALNVSNKTLKKKNTTIVICQGCKKHIQQFRTDIHYTCIQQFHTVNHPICRSSTPKEIQNIVYLMQTIVPLTT